MTEVVRRVGVDVPAALSAYVTRPFKLVQIELPAPYGLRYYSTGPQMVFETHTFVEGECDVGDMSWTGDAEQNGTLTLYNDETFDKTKMILATRASEFPVKVWDVYALAAGGFTTPELVAVGVLIGSSLTNDGVALTISVETAKATRIPARPLSRSSGFNWLPIPGTSLVWGNDTYIFEADNG